MGDDPAHVVENRRRAAAAVGCELDDLVFCEQVHGSGVGRVGETDRGRGARRAHEAFPGADALVTGVIGPTLVGLGADCPVVALVDPEAPVLGVAHAGWRGIAGGVIEATVDAMIELGARPDRMRAVVSPAIGPCCYEVGPDVVEQIGSEHARPGRASNPHLDLRSAVEARVRRQGIDGPIEGEAICTACERERLFSYRAEGGRPTGRHALMARLLASDR